MRGTLCLGWDLSLKDVEDKFRGATASFFVILSL